MTDADKQGEQDSQPRDEIEEEDSEDWLHEERDSLFDEDEGEGLYEDSEHLYEDWDDLAADPEEVSRFAKAIEGLVPDIVKRGVGGLVSDDGIRAMVKERELPREAVGFILGQVDATKREVVRIVSKEVRMFLENVDLGGELTKILTSVSFEVRTEVRFIPNDSAVKPNVRNRVRVRGQQGQEDREDGDDDSAEMEQDQEPPSSPRRRRWSFRGRANGEENRKKGQEESDEEGDEK